MHNIIRTVFFRRLAAQYRVLGGIICDGMPSAVQRPSVRLFDCPASWGNRLITCSCVSFFATTTAVRTLNYKVLQQAFDK
jgi:hypothetical protein